MTSFLPHNLVNGNGTEASDFIGSNPSIANPTECGAIYGEISKWSHTHPSTFTLKETCSLLKKCRT